MTIRLSTVGLFSPRIRLLTLITGVFCICQVPVSRAISFISTNHFDLPEESALTEEAWIGCDNATVSGTLQNDLLIAAQESVLSGTFNMDLWAVAQDIIYAGQCAGHVRLAAKSIVFSGSASDNVLCVASTIDITTNASIRGDITLAGENAMFQGLLDGNLTVYAAHATLGGVIHGSVSVIADDIVVMPSTVIEGQLEYFSSKELFLDSSVKLGGTLQQKEFPVPPQKEQSWSDRLMFQAFFYMSALIAALAWIFLFPTLSMCAVSIFRESLLKCFLIGLAALVCIPAIALMFFVSLLGIPLALMLTTACASMLYIAKGISAYAIGLMILRRPAGQPFLQNAFTVLSAGLLCIYLPAVLPSLSFFIWILTTCCGLGALLLAIFRLRTRNKLLITITDTRQDTPPKEET